MKEEFKEIGKKLPYVEPAGYVESLLERCASHAIEEAQSRNARVSRLKHIAYAATGLAAAVLAAVVLLVPAIDGESAGSGAITAEAIAESEPLGDVLAGLSNDQLAGLDYYTFDDLPESEE